MSAGASCPPDPARPDPVVRSRRHWLAAAPLGLTALALQPTPLWAATAAPALGDPVLWPTVTLLDGRVFGAEQWGAAIRRRRRSQRDGVRMRATHPVRALARLWWWVL